jgi:hypothetical protein
MDAHLTSFAVRDGRIEAIYDLADPDKLARVRPAQALSERTSQTQTPSTNSDGRRSRSSTVD